MLEFKTLATGSTGNCYLLSDGSSSLIIEAGISFKEIQKRSGFRTSKVAGLLVTHEHQDHCKGVESCLKRGMKIYMSQGTKDGIGLDSVQINIIKAKQPFRVGTFQVLPFDVQHDVNEPLGFIIQSDNGGKLLFATDTYYIKYKFNGLTHIAIECNYDEQTLNENIDNGRLHRSLMKRVVASHFSLENVLEFFKANDLSKVEEIHLLHLSDGNSNEERIRKSVERATGKLVIIP